MKKLFFGMVFLIGISFIQSAHAQTCDFSFNNTSGCSIPLFIDYNGYAGTHPYTIPTGSSILNIPSCTSWDEAFFVGSMGTFVWFDNSVVSTGGSGGLTRCSSSITIDWNINSHHIDIY